MTVRKLLISLLELPSECLEMEVHIEDGLHPVNVVYIPDAYPDMVVLETK